MRACVELGGRSLSQYSQFGRSCSAMIVASCYAKASSQIERTSRMTNFPRFRTSAHRDISRVGKGEFSRRARRLLEKIVGPWCPTLHLLPLPYGARDVRRRGLANCRWRARKARRRCGLGDAVTVDENFSRRHVRVQRGFRHGQDWREADVGAFHDLAPLLAGLGLEDFGQLLPERGPS